MPRPLSDLASPAILINDRGLERNLHAMQGACDAVGVELWPHIKTHKMVPVLRRQLELGATGATCAKTGEAEALLPSGVRRIFIAHSLADRRLAPRLRALSTQLDELLVAVTSEPHHEALEAILEAAGLTLPVLMAMDTGLGREGARGRESAVRLATRIRASSRMDLIGLYTHEGQAYQTESPQKTASEVYQALAETAEAIGGDLPLWPGCSVTVAHLIGRPGVKAVRPGAYVFGDLFLAETTGVMPATDVALTVLATVIDRPVPGLALIDAGSKVFSSDKTSGGQTARCVELPDIVVTRLSEEHGFLTGPGVDDLPLGRRLTFIPAHVCPVVNLATEVHLIRDEAVLTTWPVDARGRSD